jgi:two-component system, NtrC family, response regulator HydG
MAKTDTVTPGAAVLVIDDEELMRDSLREALGRRGYAVRVAADGASGLAALREEEADAVVCDLRMPGLSGLDVCEKIAASGPAAPPVVVVTAYGSVETAVQAMKLGAFDYIIKPFKADELGVVLERALRHRRVLRENQFLRAELEGTPDRFEIVGRSPAIARTLDLVDRYAASSATVLIRGESGTGKELVARAIHFRSARRGRPFLCVNCAALSAGLLESELFGHEKGAFTGADRMRQGRFELADGGTIFLDEVSEIDPKLQAKLLRVLQERSFERVGSSRTLQVDVRVLATSNRDLEREVREGRFREDLFFRLNILPVEVPPLRERREDIPLLVEHFLERNRRRGGGAPRRVEPEVMDLLGVYPWPGNVRELENVVERAWVLADGPVLGRAAFPGIAGAAPASAPVGIPEDPGKLAGLSIEEVERLMIRDALRRYGGHQKRTASELGIGVRTLRTKIKKWRLDGEGRPGIGRAAVREPVAAERN